MSIIHQVGSLSAHEIENIIQKMDDTWISYKNSQRGEGYWVKIEERSKRYAAAFFGRPLFEKEEEAKNAAINFRNEFIREYKLVPAEHVAKIPSRRYKATSNLSGLAGIRLSLSSRGDENALFARWVGESVNGPVSFGLSKYGYTKAYYKALEVRLDFLLQKDKINHYPPPSKKEVEIYLKNKLGEDWKNQIYNYDSWWVKDDSNSLYDPSLLNADLSYT